MVKKKQPDFQPTKLRVGKRLPKGRNVTNTSFKAKKIITKDQKFKKFVKDIPLKDLLSLSKNKNRDAKIAGLKKVRKYTEKNSFDPASDFSVILNSVGSDVFNVDKDIRQESMELLTGCFDMLSTPQINCFAHQLTSLLDCMMTHGSLLVRKDSLYFLTALLDSHPNLICRYTKCLQNLLNLISSIKYKPNGKDKERRLDDNINSSVTSVQWRDQVLKLIVKFLQNLVDNFSKSKKPHDDEQRVYWDGKGPLYLPLYAGSGLTPAKLEDWSYSSISEGKVTSELRLFVKDLVSVMCDVVTEEVASLEVDETDSSILKPEHIERLKTVTEVFASLADWHRLKNTWKEDGDFLQLINKIICEKLMKGFPYISQDMPGKKSCRKSEKLSCIQLNLGISYLYSTFLLGTELSTSRSEESCLAPVGYAIPDESFSNPTCLSLVLKISRNFMDYMACANDTSRNYNEKLSSILSDLAVSYPTLDDSNAVKMLQSFFVDISLDYKYKYLFKMEGMEKVIQVIFNEIRYMKTEADRKGNKNILKCINQLCIREQPAVLEILKKYSHLEMLGYLKVDDEDIQFTAMNMITSMRNLPVDFLQDIADFILTDPGLLSKTAGKFIRLLHIRFSDARVPLEEYSEFMRFLISVAIDSLSIEKASLESRQFYLKFQSMGGVIEEDNLIPKKDRNFSNEESLKMLFLNDITPLCHFYFIPLDGNVDRHSEISKVCIECLSLYRKQEGIFKWINEFLRACANSNRFMPVHSAIALKKLSEKFYDENNSALVLQELLSSAFFYISVLTDKFSVEKLKNAGIKELLNGLDLTCASVHHLFQVIFAKLGKSSDSSEKTQYHTLRIVNFFLQKHFLDSDDLEYAGKMFHHIRNTNSMGEVQALTAKFLDLMGHEY